MSRRGRNRARESERYAQWEEVDEDPKEIQGSLEYRPPKEHMEAMKKLREIEDDMGRWWSGYKNVDGTRDRIG